MDRNFARTINPRILELLDRYNLKPKDIRQMYFQNEKLTFDNAQIYADMTGDLQFVEGIHKAARIQVEKNSAPMYLYKFSFDDELTVNRLSLDTKIPGNNTS